MSRERFVFYIDWRAWALPLLVSVDRYTSTITLSILCVHLHWDPRPDEVYGAERQPGDM